MPKIQIENINYVVAGAKEKILNLDVSVVSDNGSARKNNVSFFTESNTIDMQQIDPSIGGQNIELTCIGDLSVGFRNVNPHGFRFLESPDKVAYALFDAKDVALKSKVAKRIEKTTNDLEDYLSSELDMYFPHLRKDPLGFVQLKEYAYGMTDHTVVAPVLKSTTLYKTKMEHDVLSSEEAQAYTAKPLWNSFLNPYDRYGSVADRDPESLENLIPIYLYTPLANLRSVVYSMLSSEYQDSSEVEAKVSEVVSSYNSFREFICSRYDSQSMISVLFKPAYNFQNIEHNYIMEMPIDIPSVKDNPYEKGIVYADMIMGKNVYNDIYDMDISSVGEFRRAREYQTISQTGNRLFTSYFDDVQYEKQDPSKAYSNTYLDQTENVAVDNAIYPAQNERDYVKIECIDAINRFIALTNHKANVFSVKVYGLDDALNKRNDILSGDGIKNNIKTSIENSIRRIVTNFVPAHTQYFGLTGSEIWKDSMDDERKTTEHC